MAGFLYYKPGKRKNNQVTLEEVQSWGLGYAFSAAPNSIDVGINTPDSKHGFVFCDEQQLDGHTPGMYLDEQDWRKIPGRGDDPIWVGCYRDAKPTPDDLACAEQMAGYPLTLRDGNDWRIPLVRQFEETASDYLVSRLPVKLDVDDDGNICDGQVIEAYKYLWDVTEKYAAAYMEIMAEQQEINLEANDILGDAVLLLSGNYRIGLGEALLLDLFSRNVWDLPLSICLLAIDYGQLVEWIDQQKKTVPQQDCDTEPTAAGNSDSLEVTPQLAQTS